MKVKNLKNDALLIPEDSGIGQISQIPKSIEFKKNSFSPEETLSKVEILNVSFQTNEKKTNNAIKKNSNTTNITTISKNKSSLTEIFEDIDEDNFSLGLNLNIHAEIMHKNFLNKSIMDFNKGKNRNKSIIFTEPATCTLNEDIASQCRANSENFFNIEEKRSLFEYQPEFQKGFQIFEKQGGENSNAKKSFRPNFKVEFNNKLPPTDENVGLSSRLYNNLEEEVKILKKIKEENLLKKKKGKRNFNKPFSVVNQNLEVFQLHKNFEKSMELFKKEEEEFMNKINKLNLLEEDSSSNEREKSKLEKIFEDSLFNIVLEEKAFSKDLDSKKTSKDVQKGLDSKVFESKFSKMTVNSNISSIFILFLKLFNNFF